MPTSLVAVTAVLDVRFDHARTGIAVGLVLVAIVAAIGVGARRSARAIVRDALAAQVEELLALAIEREPRFRHVYVVVIVDVPARRGSVVHIEVVGFVTNAETRDAVLQTIEQNAGTLLAQFTIDDRLRVLGTHPGSRRAA